MLKSRSVILDDPNGFKRPTVDTKEHIFPNNNPKKQIKVNRNERIIRRKIYTKYYGDKIGGIISPRSSSVPLEKKLPSKPCNSDYNVINNEAKKNANVRYFFENNVSQWNLI